MVPTCLSGGLSQEEFHTDILWGGFICLAKPQVFDLGRFGISQKVVIDSECGF